jgi:predicted Zn-dependent protease
MTDAAAVVTASSGKGVGFAEASSRRVADVDAARIGALAAEQARQGSEARALAPGRVRTVLGPRAVADLLYAFSLYALCAVPFLDGRSYLSGRIGERIFASAFTLTDDGSDGRGFPKSFDFEGTRKQPTPLVEEGVARGVVWDRRTAAAAGDGRRSTGHAQRPDLRGYGPRPANLRLDPGRAEVGELVDLVGEGLYLTRLHYLSMVDPAGLVLTATSRDGAFEIHRGRLGRAVPATRLRLSLPELFGELIGLGSELVLVNESDLLGPRYPEGILTPFVGTAALDVAG